MPSQGLSSYPLFFSLLKAINAMEMDSNGKVSKKRGKIMFETYCIPKAYALHQKRIFFFAFLFRLQNNPCSSIVLQVVGKVLWLQAYLTFCEYLH